MKIDRLIDESNITEENLEAILPYIVFQKHKMWTIRNVIDISETLINFTTKKNYSKENQISLEEGSKETNQFHRDIKDLLSTILSFRNKFKDSEELDSMSSKYGTIFANADGFLYDKKTIFIVMKNFNVHGRVLEISTSVDVSNMDLFENLLEMKKNLLGANINWLIEKWNK